MWFDIIKKPETTTFVVKDSIWNAAGGEGMDGILDLEKKLNRKLTFDDFDDSSANWHTDRLNDLKNKHPETHELLMDRLGGIEGTKKLAKKYLNRTEKFPSRYAKTPDNEIEAKRILNI